MDVARGYRVTGHIVSVPSLYSESAGHPASLVLRFDYIQVETKTIPVTFSVRAAASYYRAYDAEYLALPQSQFPNTHALIGGELRCDPAHSTRHNVALFSNSAMLLLIRSSLLQVAVEKTKKQMVWASPPHLLPSK